MSGTLPSAGSGQALPGLAPVGNSSSRRACGRQNDSPWFVYLRRFVGFVLGSQPATLAAWQLCAFRQRFSAGRVHRPADLGPDADLTRSLESTLSSCYFGTRGRQTRQMLLGMVVAKLCCKKEHSYDPYRRTNRNEVSIDPVVHIIAVRLRISAGAAKTRVTGAGLLGCMAEWSRFWQVCRELGRSCAIVQGRRDQRAMAQRSG